MDPAKYEFQSEFAKRYLSQGRAEGRAEGEAKGRAEGASMGGARVLLKLLALKFGPVPTTVIDRLQRASVEELERWTERVLSSATLDDVLR
jgi:predicted transposase YdaD